MSVRILDAKKGNLLLEREYAQMLSKPGCVVCEDLTSLNSVLGQGFYKEMYFDGIHIGYGDVALRSKTSFILESDAESVEMHFALKGSSSAKSENFDYNVDFGLNQHNIIYTNKMRGLMVWEKMDSQLFEINLAPSVFLKYLSAGDRQMERFHTAIKKKRSDLFKKQHYPITHQMELVIREIIDCKRTGFYKKMFLEAKVIELLLLQFEQFAVDITPPVIKKQEVEKLYAVKEFMQENMARGISMSDLAAKFATNEFMLKKGFKELFGMTVFGFWNDIKMLEAKRMLLDQDLNVNEVAEAVGYQNARHFSTAFKTRFGITPGKLKSGTI